MSKRVPKFIVEIYGSAHKFRADKRKLLKKIEPLVDELRRGSAYFPDEGMKDVSLMLEAVRQLRAKLTTRAWGK